jgi:hypothetical protein
LKLITFLCEAKIHCACGNWLHFECVWRILLADC